MPKGYVGKLLWVDLTSGKVATTALDEATARACLGGSGLGAKLIHERVRTIKGPLDPSNVLCFMPGLLCGTVVPGANRTMVCALSPATTAWGEARAGGAWGPTLKYAGYDGLIVTGKAKAPVYLWIENDQVEIRPADRVWGKGFFETDARLLEETHKDAVVAGIGQAGEKLAAMACVMFEGTYARSAGRTGMGAVMGSKHLKAVVVRGTGGVPVANPTGLMKRAAEYGGKEKTLFKRNFDLGTAGTVMATEAVGDMPIRNFLGGRWAEKAERVSGQVMFKKYGKHERSCLSCPSNCTLVVGRPAPGSATPRSTRPSAPSAACASATASRSSPAATSSATITGWTRSRRATRSPSPWRPSRRGCSARRSWGCRCAGETARR